MTTGLPFALALTNHHGALTYLAQFRYTADLWTFFDAWRVECPQSLGEARFVHKGRMVRIHTPSTRQAAIAWVTLCLAADTDGPAVTPLR